MLINVINNTTPKDTHYVLMMQRINRWLGQFANKEIGSQSSLGLHVAEILVVKISSK